MIEIINYTSDWHDKLLTFMIYQFPNRTKDYLCWWIRQMERSLGNKRALLAIEDGKIVGCTTAVYTKIKICDKEYPTYWECNTIVDRRQRGRGIGRMLYEGMNRYEDRITAGFTKAAWKIQPQIMKKFNELASVNVYISANIWCIKTIFDALIHKDKVHFNAPVLLRVSNCLFKKVSSVKEIPIPNDGYWLGNEVELIRDQSFLYNRFEDIYRKYVVYQGFVGNSFVGYFVVRATSLYGIPMLTLVDYRGIYSDFFKLVRLALNNIAFKNKMGFSIMLTSQRETMLTWNPLTVRLRKRLNVATSLPNITADTNLLITSADSDLDFVYYL